jgi:predicted HD superfamily hydrolase involved in NAD metabolism
VAEHVARVAALARRIAARDGVAEEPVLTAAWLHDISQVLPPEAMPAAALKYGIDLLPEERQAPGLIHQKLSSVFAERLFGVSDPAVLAAIRCHTTLRSGATLLDKALFAADKLAWDPKDAPYQPEMAAALAESTEQAVWCWFRWTWERRDQMQVIHPWLRAAFEDLSRRHSP